MMFDRMRVYDAGRFIDTELPDWYHEAGRLSQADAWTGTTRSDACSAANTRS